MANSRGRSRVVNSQSTRCRCSILGDTFRAAVIVRGNTCAGSGVLRLRIGASGMCQRQVDDWRGYRGKVRGVADVPVGRRRGVVGVGRSMRRTRGLASACVAGLGWPGARIRAFRAPGCRAGSECARRRRRGRSGASWTNWRHVCVSTHRCDAVGRVGTSTGDAMIAHSNLKPCAHRTLDVRYISICEIPRASSNEGMHVLARRPPA